MALSRYECIIGGLSQRMSSEALLRSFFASFRSQLFSIRGDTKGQLLDKLFDDFLNAAHINM